MNRILLGLAILAAVALAVGGGVAFAGAAGGGKPAPGGGMMMQGGATAGEPSQSPAQPAQDGGQPDLSQFTQGGRGSGNCPNMDGQGGQTPENAPGSRNGPGSTDGSNL